MHNRDHDGLAMLSKLEDSGINTAKEYLISTIFETPDNISFLLSDVAEMIARDEFNKKWPNFIPDLVAGLEGYDPIKCHRVFRTLCPVFTKIRNMYRSDELYTQILYTIETMGVALTETIKVRIYHILPQI